MRAHEAGALHAHGYGGPPLWLPYPEDVNALLPQLWARSVQREDAGHLSVGGVAVTELAHEFGTPAYLVDEADFRRRAREFYTAFTSATSDCAGATVSYAAKAFLCTAAARWVNEEGLHLDVCTEGELAVAIRAGTPGHHLTLHGNNKSDVFLAEALRVGVGRIVVDSFDEIRRLHALARSTGTRVPVMVRVTVGVEAHTHEYIATAHEDQKFGFSLAGGAAAKAVRTLLNDPECFELRGLHSHIGSQIFDGQGFALAIERLVGFWAAMRDAHDVSWDQLNLGGGFGMAYTSAHTPATPDELASALIGSVADATRQHDLPVPHVLIEPGRAISGPSTCTLYRVGTVKEVQFSSGAVRTYVSVDGGMSDNLRTALYEADYSATLASRAGVNVPRLVRIVGQHCESGDVVVLDEYLPDDVAPGDLVAVPGTGAYCRSLSTQYNHTPRPPVIAVKDGQAREIIRRETIDDLLAFDVDA